MAVTASMVKELREIDRRRNDGLVKKLLVKQTAIWTQPLNI